jgi:hypothetical protein
MRDVLCFVRGYELNLYLLFRISPVFETVVHKLFFWSPPLGFINRSPASLALPCKEHSSERRFAQPPTEDCNNKIRYQI